MFANKKQQINDTLKKIRVLAGYYYQIMEVHGVPFLFFLFHSSGWIFSNFLQIFNIVVVFRKNHNGKKMVLNIQDPCFLQRITINCCYFVIIISWNCVVLWFNTSFHTNSLLNICGIWLKFQILTNFSKNENMLWYWSETPFCGKWNMEFGFQTPYLQKGVSTRKLWIHKMLGFLIYSEYNCFVIIKKLVRLTTGNPTLLDSHLNSLNFV